MLKHEIRILFIIQEIKADHGLLNTNHGQHGLMYLVGHGQIKPNISLCFRLIDTTDLKAALNFSSSFQSLQLVMNHKVNYGLIISKVQIKKRKATGCNNRDDLLQLSFTLKISIFSEASV